MPVFDYVCPNCNHVEEKIVKTSEAVVNCSKCNSISTKQLSVPTFILKGDGFYSRGTFSKALQQGPYIPKHIQEMPEAQLDKELGLT